MAPKNPSPLEYARGRLREIAGDVADFIARGKRPRELTLEEKRLAIDDPAAFEELLARVQRDYLRDQRDEAIHATLAEDVRRMESEEAEKQRTALREERAKLLEQRYISAMEVDGCIHDLDAALVDFGELNRRISRLDRDLDENDRHRASHGLVLNAFKRTLFHHSPALWKLLGMPLPPGGGGSGRTLGQTFAVPTSLDPDFPKEN